MLSLYLRSIKKKTIQSLISLMLPLNSQWSQGCTWTPNSPDFTSQVLWLKAHAILSGLWSVGDWTQDFVNARQWFCQLHRISCPNALFLVRRCGNELLIFSATDRDRSWKSTWNLRHIVWDSLLTMCLHFYHYPLQILSWAQIQYILGALVCSIIWK